jgi:hypothetical protein
MIQSWVREYAHDLGADPRDAMQRLAAETVHHIEPLRAAATEVFDRFLELVAGATGS